MSQKSITAIVVTYNSENIIRQAIAALEADPAVTKIIVVDNNSQDDTRDIVRKSSRVTLIENPKNEGFGRANNIGLEKVETPYALLVNPDAILSAGAVDTLLAAAENYKDAAILAPGLYDEEGNLHLSFKRNVFNREATRSNYIEPEGDACPEFLSGAVWMLNMALIKKVGFFDPNIFLYYEDDDLCLRVRQAGYGLVYVPAAHAIHLQGASSGAHKPDVEFFKQKHMAWSRLYIEEKYNGKESAYKLANKLTKKYNIKFGLYTIQFNRMGISRYRGRLAGVAEFSVQNKTQQAA